MHYCCIYVDVVVQSVNSKWKFTTKLTTACLTTQAAQIERSKGTADIVICYSSLNLYFICSLTVTFLACLQEHWSGEFYDNLGEEKKKFNLNDATFMAFWVGPAVFCKYCPDKWRGVNQPALTRATPGKIDRGRFRCIVIVKLFIKVPASAWLYNALNNSNGGLRRLVLLIMLCRIVRYWRIIIMCRIHKAGRNRLAWCVSFTVTACACYR